MSTDDQSFAAQKQQYVDALQRKAVRVKELEIENGMLIAELTSVRRQRQPSSIVEKDHRPEGKDSSIAESQDESKARTVDIEEHNRVKHMLAESYEDYGKVIFARQVLESKLRHYKDMTKQWREYTDRWILKYPKRGLKSLEAATSEASPAAMTRDLRHSSAPAPPPVPDGMTPSVSDISRDASPCVGAERERVRQGSGPQHSHNATLKPLPDRIVATQKALDGRNGGVSGDVTEASDESGRVLSDLSRSPSRKIVELVGQNVEEQVEDDGSSPIVVAERSLKRKWPVKVLEEYDHTNSLPAKEEQLSSSPPAALTSGFGENHESLDLDDVEGHVDTPRKRMKMEQMRLLSLSRVHPPASQDEEQMLDVFADQGLKHDVSIKTGNGKQNFSDVRPPLSRLTADSRAQNDEEQQSRRRKALSKAQQQAHNKRVNERLDSGEQPAAGNAHPRKSSSASKDIRGQPKAPGRRDYPTPATEDPMPRTPQCRRQMEQLGVALASPIILQPTDANAQILPRTHEKPTYPKPSCPPSRRDRGAAHVPALAEDGEDSPSFGDSSKVKHANPSVTSNNISRAPDLHHRLGTLLSDPSPAKSLIESQSHRHRSPEGTSSKTPVGRFDHNPGSKAPTTPLSMPAQKSTIVISQRDKAGPKQYRSVEGAASGLIASAQAINKNQTKKSTARRPSPIKQSADARPGNEPLRVRPLHRLRIEDFKLNPSHSDYAYHESVRKHDEKKALAGCTDRNCPRCKDIREFVEHSGYARVPGLSEEETNQRLLEAFLGNDKSRLEKMSADEKKEILAQAKSQHFVDHFGKHRTPFQRAQSPVDYWNVGFPSTQEHEQNLEAVRDREREKVKEMYWEAIRERGRYVFADE